MRVLEDNLRVPSGISYVVENREALTRVFPGLFLEQQVQPVAGFVATCSTRCAPPRRPASTTRPWCCSARASTTRPTSSTPSSPARWASSWSRAATWSVSDNVLYMRTTSGRRRVDVVYRRIDDDYLDPLQFRPDSVIGTPGLLNAARAGNVTIANAIGNGVADDKLTYTYVPALIEYYLGEQAAAAERADLPAGRAGRLGRAPGPGRPAGVQAGRTAPAATAS